MTYDEYKDYIMRSVWREGDTTLESDLPQLIKEAEARISRDTTDISLEVRVADTVGAEKSFPLPSSFKRMRSVSIPGVQELHPLNAAQVRAGDAVGWALVEGKLVLSGVDEGAVVEYIYSTRLVPYEDDPLVPFAALEPDLYKAAVLAQVWNYLLNEQQAKIWESVYSTLVNSKIDDHYRRINASEQVRMAGTGSGAW